MTLAQGQNWVKPQLCREAGQSLPGRPSHYEVLKETSFLKVSRSGSRAPDHHDICNMQNSNINIYNCLSHSFPPSILHLTLTLYANDVALLCYNPESAFTSLSVHAATAGVGGGQGRPGSSTNQYTQHACLASLLPLPSLLYVADEKFLPCSQSVCRQLPGNCIRNSPNDSGQVQCQIPSFI